MIHEILVMFKNYLNYFKDNIFECFFKDYNLLLFIFFLKNPFFVNIIMESLSLEKEKIIKDIRNLLD